MTFITDEWNGKEFFKINDFHHVEFYVNNAKQAVFYYSNLFGFEVCGYKGPETECFDSVSYLLMSGKAIDFLFDADYEKSELFFVGI